ncbi:MAG: hypothetical protein MUE88_02990 [Flavobacteriales bacterium]|nr:hypothetical protein [Flavobacteriales bacterium]
MRHWPPCSSSEPASCALRSDAQAVMLTGWLHVDDLRMNEITVEVEVDGAIELASVSRNGRFSVELPVGTEAVLRFERIGYQSKEVVVDTRHAHDGPMADEARTVTFAVVLEPERYMGGQIFAGPIARLGFEPGGGCVAVSHTRTLVPARRQTPMVF